MERGRPYWDSTTMGKVCDNVSVFRLRLLYGFWKVVSRVVSEESLRFLFEVNHDGLCPVSSPESSFCSSFVRRTKL